MKPEIDSHERLGQWFANSEPAVFQGLDLSPFSAQFSLTSLSGCVFLGCRLAPDTAHRAADAGCLIVPPFPNLPFNAFEPGLYTPDELYEGYDPERHSETFEICLDTRIYRSFAAKDTGKALPVDVDVAIARRIHDASISDALHDDLVLPVRRKTVAVMGGHDVPRNHQTYREVADLSLQLSALGYHIVTGGGPGLMEAANLGAYCNGFENASARLSEVLGAIQDAPTYKDRAWLSTAFKAWRAMGIPNDATKSRSLGIPTWFYGHEPPNVFASHIAKYFENSEREEGLLAIALAGVIFAPGNGGTVQEMFQDACQNYYATYEDTKSPMILFGKDYWAPDRKLLHHAGERSKPAFPLLEKLAAEKGFSDRLLLTDSVKDIVDHIKRFSPL